MTRIYSMSAYTVDYSPGREDFFRELLKFSLAPKSKTRGEQVINMADAKDQLRAWIFVGDKEFGSHKSCKTLTTFSGYQQSFGEYFTPNGFFNRHQRDKRFLRHLNAMFVDIDMTITPSEVLELISFNCLPCPSAIIRTPGGGCHVYWFLDKPVPGTPKAVAFYEDLQRTMAFVLGADRFAVGAERYMRTPRLDLAHYYHLSSRYTLQDFADWRSLYLPARCSEERSSIFWAEHPGVPVLLQGVEEGRRNCSAFALSLHYKSLGMCCEWTLDKLLRWNTLNSPPLTTHELEYIVRRVYRIDRYKFYPVKMLSTLTGIQAKRKIWTAKKTRADRTRVHYTEWIGDIHALLLTLGKNKMVTTVRRLAAVLGANRDVVAKVFKLMQEDYQKTYKIYVIGKGSRRRTVIQLLQSIQDPLPDNKIIPPEVTEIGEGCLSDSRVHVSSGGWVGFPSCETPLKSEGLEGG